MTRRKFALLSGAAVVGAYGSVKLQKVEKPPQLAADRTRSDPNRGRSASAQPERREWRNQVRAAICLLHD